MRIAILGANGQVASEVTAMLAGVEGIDVRPISRSRGGSAFLRRQGIAVLHGDVSDRARATEMLAGADVVANFALASGSPVEALTRNSTIIRRSFEASSPKAVVVFFSTLSVHGQYDATGKRFDTFYGDMKIKNEKLVAMLAKRMGRKAYILRLGQVAGDWQGISQQIRHGVQAGRVACPDPDRASNVTFTNMIAEALLVVGRGNAGRPGLYDLVNQPQWSWRQVCQYEADKLGLPLNLEVLPTGARARRSVKHVTLGMIQALGLRERVLRAAAVLPADLSGRLRADFFASRARSEIAGLNPPRGPSLLAMAWPAISVRNPPGLRDTIELIDKNAFPIAASYGPAWPSDLSS
jgi:nucleoside-diphosphate-sugar epimerase